MIQGTHSNKTIMENMSISHHLQYLKNMICVNLNIIVIILFIIISVTTIH